MAITLPSLMKKDYHAWRVLASRASRLPAPKPEPDPALQGGTPAHSTTGTTA
jgi:hypothetical protein